MIDLGPCFKPFPERVKGERERRLKHAGELLSFGVAFLNIALGGIAKNDLVLLGAKSGMGKTELSSIIAMSNAMRGKRVHYFALEAEEDEIERRTKYKLLCKIVPKDPETVKRLSFLDWSYGRLEDITGPFESSLDKQFDEQFKTLHTLYRKGTFGMPELEKQILGVQDQTDLIIIDHLGYIDTDNENENRGYKLIVQRIRDVAIDIGKPVVVVAHVRKSDRRFAQLIPTLEDFHGTSDIPKIATKAIMIAPADIPAEHPWLWNTFVSIQKCRVDGQRARYVALVEFNARFGAYERSYQLGKIMGDKWEPLKRDEWPAWATEPQ